MDQIPQTLFLTDISLNNIVQSSYVPTFNKTCVFENEILIPKAFMCFGKFNPICLKVCKNGFWVCNSMTMLDPCESEKPSQSFTTPAVLILTKLL